MRILYIGMKVEGNPKTGGEYAQLRNRALLQEICKELTVLETPKIGLARHSLNLITGKSYGYTRNLMKQIDGELAKQYDYVFFDGSSYGYLVRHARIMGHHPVVFFHNVEVEYYKTKFHAHKSLMNYLLIYYIKHQESLSVQYAERVVALNERDSKGLDTVYGRKADYITPFFYKKIDKQELISSEKSESNDDYLLFVGANFCANNDGISWFIENVSPHIQYNTFVAGSCCKAIESMIDISNNPKVKLLGFVDDLDALYKNAKGVICPIFSGSGMKTKTIEAMMYGKSVFGSSEAFEGICVDSNQIGGICNTKEEFIDAINSSVFLKPFNEYSYDMFCTLFSEDAVVPKFKNFLEKT